MARRTSSRPWAAGALAALTLAWVAGCGNGPAPSGGTVVKPAAGSSPASKAAKAHQAHRGQAAAANGLGRSQLFPAIYAAAVKAGSAHVTMSIGGAQAVDAAGDVRYSATNPAMSLIMNSAQARGMQIRLVDHVLYMQIPGVVPAGKFLAIDARDTTSPLGKAMGPTLSQMDPLTSLRASQKAVRTVTLVGSEQVQGASTDHYRVVMDTAKAMASMKSQLPASALAALPATIVYDIWVDPQHRMRRLEYSVESVTVVSDLSRWGQPVQVERPPAYAIIRQPGA